MTLDHNTFVIVCAVGIMLGFLRAKTSQLRSVSKQNSRDIYEMRRNLKRLLQKLGEEYIINGFEEPPPPGEPFPD